MKDKKALVQAIVDRLKEVVGVTKDVELAEALGASRSTPAVWKIRDRIPFAECMEVAEQYNVSLDWLVMGRGVPGIEAIAEAAARGNGEEVASACEFPAFDMPSFLDSDSPQRTIKIPSEWITRDGLDMSEVIAMRYVGNNMAPTINDGDVVFIDRRPRDIDGVFVMRLGDSIRGKRVQRMQSGALHLLNDNPNYRTEEIEAHHAEAVEFIGYCFGILRHVR
jgi:phage repressor protein C with HTH and peptisase S24 domain